MHSAAVAVPGPARMLHASYMCAVSRLDDSPTDMANYRLASIRCGPPVLPLRSRSSPLIKRRVDAT